MKNIAFNKPIIVKIPNFLEKFSGDGPYTAKCTQWFEKKLPYSKVLLTTSCTHALEMMALLIDVMPGDEIIMPSYTFASTANAFALRGTKLIFIDINPYTITAVSLKLLAEF